MTSPEADAVTSDSVTLDSAILDSILEQTFSEFGQISKQFRMQLSPREIGTITHNANGIAIVTGLPNVGYDELVRVPETTLKSCLGFLGENFSSDCLLPMREKINSSKVAQTNLHKPSTREAEKANQFYRAILTKPPGDPEEQALKELIRHYENYADQINKG